VTAAPTVETRHAVLALVLGATPVMVVRGITGLAAGDVGTAGALVGVLAFYLALYGNRESSPDRARSPWWGPGR
jgi:hypothetical protein